MSRGHTLVRTGPNPYLTRQEPSYNWAKEFSSLDFPPPEKIKRKSFNKFTAKFSTPKVINTIHISKLNENQINYYICLAKNPHTKSCEKLGIGPQDTSWDGCPRKYWMESYGERISIPDYVGETYTFLEFMQEAEIHTVWDGTAWTASILTFSETDAPSFWTNVTHTEYETAVALAFIKKHHGEEVEDV